MEVKKMVKRMAAIGASSVMVGATLMGAMAADLKDYPSMFVTNGAFNGVFIVGDNANAADTLATIDISNNMWYNKVTTSTKATAGAGSWQVATSAKFLELSNSNVSHGSIAGETFNAISSYIGPTELPALASGKFSTGESDYPYNQYLYFDVVSGAQSGIAKFATDGHDKTSDFLYFKNGQQMFRYKLEFTSQASSDIVDSTGSASTTGAILQDFENKKITLFGKEYTIVLARRYASTKEDSVRLVLMGGSESSTILESEEKTLTVKGKEYKVKLVYVDATYAKFEVNGETTDKLQVGDTKKLKDGTEIGVSEVLYQSYAGGVHSSTFFIGAGKLELKDDEIQDNSAYSDNLLSGTESIDGAYVIISGSDSNTTFKISTIDVNITAADDYYVPANGKLSDVITLESEEKEALFTNNWDVEYKGLTSEENHDIKITTSGDRRYNLNWYDGDGKPVSMPVAYSDAQYNLSLGEDSDAASSPKHLWLSEDYIYIGGDGVTPANITNLTKNDYFVVTGGDVTSSSAKSYLMQYKGSDNTGKTSPKIKFKNIGSSETLEYAVDTTTSATRATIKVGGYSFLVNNVSSAASDDFPLEVDLNGDGDVTDAANVAIKDYFGGRIQLSTGSLRNGTSNSPDTIGINIDTPNGDDYDNVVPLTFTWNITSASGPKIAGATQGVFTSITPSGESNIAYGYTSMGGKITYSTPSSSPATFVYNYPKKQQLPQVFITTVGSAISTISGGESTPVSIPVTASKLASEVADVKAQNAIVVGGPCANAAAATLLGNPADCAEGFTPGKAKIKLFENGDKVALLVAGYAADDTRAAGKALAAYKTNMFTGKEAEIERTGSVSEYKVVAATAAAATTTTTQ